VTWQVGLVLIFLGYVLKIGAPGSGSNTARVSRHWLKCEGNAESCTRKDSDMSQGINIPEHLTAQEEIETFVFLRMDQGDEDSQIIVALVEQRHMSPSLAATLVAKMRECHTEVATDREKIMIFITSRVIKGERDRQIIAALTEQWDIPSPMAAILIMIARKKYAEVEKKIMKFIFSRLREGDDYDEIGGALIRQWNIPPVLALALVERVWESNLKVDAAIAARVPGLGMIASGIGLIILALILTGVSFFAAAFLDIHWLIFTGLFIAGLLALLRGIFVLLFGGER